MKNIISIISMALIFLVGCESFLEEDNKSNVTAEEFYVTEAGYEALINATYASTRDLFGQDPWMFACGTDLYMEGRNQEPTGLSRYSELNPSAEGIDFIYENAYKAIRLANTSIYYGTLTEESDVLAQRIGEAQFIRALSYFYLVQSYGGVALVFDHIDSEILEFDKATAEEVYNQILADLTAANTAVSTGSFDGRVTQRAVEDLMSKVYLTRAYEDFGTTADFTAAATHADAVINGQTLDLSVEDVWTPGNEMNAETIFSIQFDAASISAVPGELGSQQQNYFGSYTGGDEVAGHAPYRTYNLCPTRFALDLFVEGDERWEGTFMTEVYDRYYDYYDIDVSSVSSWRFYAPQWYDTVDSAAYVAANPGIVYTDDEGVVRVRYESYGTFDPEGGDITGNYGTILLKKFDDPTSFFASGTSTNRTSGRDFVMARLSEAYLVAAEAYLGSGNNATALDRINQVRSRAGVADVTAIDLDVILDERALELMGEYKRWFDLKRTGKLIERASAHNPLVEAGDFTGNNGMDKILRPIPQRALDLNQNRDYGQNPAYAN
ncbi:MAG: RagB/SusD family nutrient uptake outer membrane protein [Reichenbachiella sp.]